MGQRHVSGQYKLDAQASEQLTTNTLACASSLYCRANVKKWRCPNRLEGVKATFGRYHLLREKAAELVRVSHENPADEIRFIGEINRKL